MAQLDAHARPPEALRCQYKHYQKLSRNALDDDPDLLDSRRPGLSACHDRNFFHRSPDDITNLYSDFVGEPVDTLPPSLTSAGLYEHPHVPGTSLLLHGAQSSILSPW
jgi:alkylated DNA repair protein alkB family protein 1